MKLTISDTLKKENYFTLLKFNFEENLICINVAIFENKYSV